MVSRVEMPSEVGNSSSLMCRPPISQVARARRGSRRRARRALVGRGRKRFGVTDIRMGLRMVGTPPATAIGSSPSSVASSTPPRTSLIGPHGMPAAVRTSNHSVAVRVASRSSRIGRSCSRLSLRVPTEAKRSSSATSGMSSAAASLRNWLSLPAMTISSPSPVSSGSYGNNDRWALPIRWGTTSPAM